jgi:hypothetical protein
MPNDRSGTSRTSATQTLSIGPGSQSPQKHLVATGAGTSLAHGCSCSSPISRLAALIQKHRGAASMTVHRIASGTPYDRSAFDTRAESAG